MIANIPRWFVGACALAFGLFVAFRVLLAALIVVTHLIEKRPICSLVPIDRDDAPDGSRHPDGEAGAPAFNPYEAPRSTISDYAQARNLRFAELGFAPGGPYKQGKGGIYQGRYVLWQSPGRDVLASVAWGTVGGMPVDKTILYTSLDDGRYLVTSDKPTGVLAPWVFDDEIAFGTDLDGLVDRHRRRLEHSPWRALRSPGADPLDEYRAMRTRLAEASIEAGEAYYLDPGRTAIRSNLKGALLGAVRSLRAPNVWRG